MPESTISGERDMRVEKGSGSLKKKLTACRAAGLVDRFVMYPDHVIIQQGRYRHRIPARYIDAFVSGMLNYASVVESPQPIHRAAA
jgi:hypothetical protein